MFFAVGGVIVLLIGSEAHIIANLCILQFFILIFIEKGIGLISAVLISIQRLKRRYGFLIFSCLHQGNGSVVFAVWYDNGVEHHKNCLLYTSTVHGAKGLEFDQVFVLDLVENQFPASGADLAEEARLFYVAVTRAKRDVYKRQRLSLPSSIMSCAT